MNLLTQSVAGGEVVLVRSFRSRENAPEDNLLYFCGAKLCSHIGPFTPDHLVDVSINTNDCTFTIEHTPYYDSEAECAPKATFTGKLQAVITHGHTCYWK